MIWGSDCKEYKSCRNVESVEIQKCAMKLRSFSVAGGCRRDVWAEKGEINNVQSNSISGRELSFLEEKGIMKKEIEKGLSEKKRRRVIDFREGKECSVIQEEIRGKGWKSFWGWREERDGGDFWLETDLKRGTTSDVWVNSRIFSSLTGAHNRAMTESTYWAYRLKSSVPFSACCLINSMSSISSISVLSRVCWGSRREFRSSLISTNKESACLYFGGLSFNWDSSTSQNAFFITSSICVFKLRLTGVSFRSLNSPSTAISWAKYILATPFAAFITSSIATNLGGEAGIFAMRDETDEWSSGELLLLLENNEDEVTVLDVGDEQDGGLNGEDPVTSLAGLKLFFLLIESPVDEPTPSSPSSSSLDLPFCLRLTSWKTTSLPDASGATNLLSIKGLGSGFEEEQTSRGNLTSFDAWLVPGRSDSFFFPSTSTFTTVWSSILAVKIGL